MDSLLGSCTDENSLEHFINVNEELVSSDTQTSQTFRAVICIKLCLARCHRIHLILCKLPTSDLQDEIIRFGRSWVELSPDLDNLNEIFKYPCQKLYISEIIAQFHYIMGTCLLQMAQEKTVSEGDALSMATALFGLSLKEGSKVKKNLLSMNWSKDDATVLSRLSCVRVSQTWHFLNKILGLQGSDDFIRYQEKWCNESGYCQMLNQVLGLHQDDDANQWVASLICQLSLHPLSTRGIKSRDNQIVEIDYECIVNDPNNMALLVWTCMQWGGHDIETTPVFTAFMKKRGLPFSSSNLSHCSVLSFCILDIVIFLHAVANFMEEELEKLQQHLQLGSIPMMSCPYQILKLGNQRQIDWFNAVHQHLEVKESSKDFIVVVEAGLEVLRCRSHKERMGTELLIYLGRMMRELMLKYKGLQSDKKRCQAYEERCLLYWQEALDQLEKRKNGEDILESRNPLFPHSGKKFTFSEVEDLIEEASESLAECGPEGRQTRTKTPAQLPYTPPTPEDAMSEVPTPFLRDSDWRGGSPFLSSDGTYQEPSFSGRLVTPSQRSSDPPVSSNPGHSGRQQLPLSPHGYYLHEPRHSTPAERTHVSTPSLPNFDRTTSQQGEPFHSTPARRTHISTPPRHERRQKPQDELTPVGSYHHSLREDPRGTPDGSDRSPETSYLLYKTPENRSGIYKSSVADDTHYEIEVIDPSPQRLTSEVKDLNRSQHQQEAKNDELKKIQREMHEKSLSQNKQLSNNIKKLTERVLALEAEKREADNMRMNLMSGKISGLEERLNDTENKFQEFESVLEDQNKKNLECVQGLLAQVEDLKTRSKEHDMRYELLKQTQAKLQEVFIKTSNELARRHLVTQREQEKYNRELQERMNELLQNHQREWERLRSDLKQMETSVDKLDKSSTEMRTRIEGIEDKNEKNDETLRSSQKTLEQTVQELKNNLAKHKDEVEESLKGLEEKIEAVRMEKVEQTALAAAPESTQQIPPGALIGVMPYQQHTHHPQTVTYVQLAPVQGTYVPGMHEVRGTPIEEAMVQGQQIVMGGPGMHPGGDAGGYVTGLEPVSSSQVSQTANLRQPVTPMRGMRAAPLQYPSPPSGQVISVAQQPASLPQNVGQRIEAAPSPTAYPPAAAQRQQPSVVGNQLGIHLPSIPTTIGPALSTATQATQRYHSPTRQQVPPPRAAQSPFAGLSLKATTSGGGVPHPSSQVHEQSVSSSTTPRPREDATVSKSVTPAKPSVSQQEPDLLNIPVRRPGENFMSATPQIHEGGDLTPGETNKGLTEQVPSSFGDPTIAKLNFGAIAAAGDAGFVRRDQSKPFSQFPGAGAQVFESSYTPQDGDESVTDDQEYDPHFDPVISLPENVDLTTGDEGQEVVFKERAKLYRYDSDTQAWKERGVGDMKILKDPETGKARILMRREQVLKVCANHWLKPDMQLLPMSSSDRAFVWNAIDFAEGKECHEKFAVKFNTPELAADFKKTFDKMKEGVGPSFAKPVEPVKEEPAKTLQDTPASSMEEMLDQRSQQTDPLEAWGELRSQEEEEEEAKEEKIKEKEDVVPKDEDGSYEDDQRQLPSGEAKKEGTEDSDISKQQPFFSPPSLTLSSSLPQFQFSSSPRTSTSSAPHWRGMAPSGAFGSPPRQQQPSAGYSFGASPTSISSFHPPSPQDQPVPATSNLQTLEEPFHGSGPSAVSLPSSGEKLPAKSPGLNISGEYYPEEKRDDVHLEPMVTLPENYKLGTGEEKEEVKFSQRAKLYHFDAEGSQWKERGVGDIKVLYNPETKQHRIVMRREQDLTMCANHLITQHVNLQPNKGSERSWVWWAMDSSDGDPQNKQLFVTFDTEDAARKFKGVVDDSKKNLPGTSDEPVEPIGKADTKKGLVPAVSDKQEEGDYDREGEDKTKELTKKEQEDTKPAIESKETEPTRPTQDVKRKEKGEVKETEEKKEVEREQEIRKEKESPAPASVRTKDEDVATKEQEVIPPPAEDEDKAKPLKVPGQVESKDSTKVTSKPSEDVKKKDEVKEAGKDEDSLKEKKEGETEEKKGLVPAVSDKQEEGDYDREREDKAKEVTKKEAEDTKPAVESKETEPTRPTQDVKRKEEDEVKETGKDETLEDKKEEKTKEETKETASTSPEKAKEADEKQKEIVSTPAKDKSKGDEKPTKPADEEAVKEEEKEEEVSNREIRFSAPADLSYADENKWKLRGKGQFQILFDKDNKNYLVEMRKDEDNSLCAKHPITKAIQLMPVRGQDRSYAWSAMDTSDKESSPVSMTFAVRFKNRETADNFQEEFQKAQTPVAEPPQAGKGKDKKEKKKTKKDKDKKGDHSLHQSNPSLHSSQVSLTPSQASSQPEDAPQSPKSPKSPKDADEKKPEKKKKKGFFKRVKDKVTEMWEGSDESDGGGGGSSSASSSSESSSDEDK